MNLLDRFSTHLKEVITRAIRLATELGNKEVDPIHLLFALALEKGSVGAELLQRFKITSKAIEPLLLDLPGSRERRGGEGAATEAVITPLSESAKRALEAAMLAAEAHHHTYIGSEHMLRGLIKINDALITKLLADLGVKFDELERQVGTVLGNAAQFPQLNEVADMVDRAHDHMNDLFEGGSAPFSAGARKHSHNHNKESALDFFATNLTDPEIEDDLDPVIGRAPEIDRVIHILSRRTKNNPILLGEPGVGKTAIVEGLAKRILNGDVPEVLANKKIYALDLSLLIAGTMYRGEFEGRLRQVIEEVTDRTDIILFIDEVHNIVGTGSNQGTMDAGNILKPALARGQIRCIGATTPAEFKKYIENDAALERRFQPVLVKEPSAEETLAILKGVKSQYERYHALKISTGALMAAVQLAERYVTNKFFPDKAIDLVDETAAAKRVTLPAPKEQRRLSKLERQLDKTILTKEQAAASDNFAEAVRAKQAEETLKAQIKKLRDKLEKSQPEWRGTITDRDVILQVAKLTGTTPTEIMREQANQLVSLADTLKEAIIGQDDAVNELAACVQRARLGLGIPDRPLASFLFVGPSGVGKTELALTLAKNLYPGKNALIKLNMTEYSEGFGVSKLLGSPAGYVGYKESNPFTDQLKFNPYAVILFDEIDKAHKDVVRLLLDILERGEIADSTGKKISLRQCIILLTTTFGAEEMQKGPVGFGHSNNAKGETRERLMERLKERFSPEVINRLDSVLVFNPLSTPTLERIAKLELTRLNKRLERYKTQLLPDAGALEWLVSDHGRKNISAREVRQKVTQEIENVLAGVILAKRKIPLRQTLSVREGKLVVH